jgi:hypothetical protein
MKTLAFDPSDYPEWDQYGLPNRAADGSIIYSGSPYFTVLFPGLLIATNPDGSPASTGTILEFYATYLDSLNQTDGRLWVNRWNPATLTWQKVVARVLWADWSGKFNGVGIVNLAIHFCGVGITAPDYAGGEPNPPDPETGSNGEDPVLPEHAGEFGVGLFGVGPYGFGQDIY